MQKNLVNITLAVVTEEVEMILESYPKHPYQQAFSPSGLATRFNCLRAEPSS